MTKYLRLCLPAIILVCYAQFSAAEPPVLDCGPLARETQAGRKLTGTETHVYALTADAGEFVQVEVAQLDVLDVEIGVEGPDGAEILRADRPEMTLGTETASFIAPQSGVYQLRVTGLDEAMHGSYAARIAAQRPATPPDRRLVRAQRLHERAVELAEEGAISEALTRETQALAALPAESAASRAEFLYHLGLLHLDLGAATPARAAWQQALDLQRNHAQTPPLDIARTIHQLAVLATNAGNYVAAQDWYAQEQTLLEQALPLNHPDLAVFYINQAQMYHEMGAYADESRLSIQALSIAEAALPLPSASRADALHQAAQAHYATGRYDQAGPLCQQALDIYRQVYQQSGNDPEAAQRLAGAYHLQGLIQAATGAYPQAQASHQEALACHRRTPEPSPTDVAESYTNLADLLSRQLHAGQSPDPTRDYAQATAYYLQALELLSQQPALNSRHFAIVTQNYARLLSEQGHYAAAARYYRQSLRALRRQLGPRHPLVGLLLNNFARLHLDRQQPRRAARLLSAAQRVLQAKLPPDHPDLALVQRNLARLALAQDRPQDALTALQESHRISEKNLAVLLDAGTAKSQEQLDAGFREELDLIWTLHLNAATRQQAAGSRQQAVKSRMVLTRRGRRSDLRQGLTREVARKQESQDTLPAGFQDEAAAQLAAQAVLRYKGRLLDAYSRQLEALRQHATPEDQKLFDELSRVRAELAQDALAGKLTPARAQELAARDDELTRQLTERSQAFRVQQQGTQIGLAQIQSLLPDNGALVEMTLYRPYQPQAKPRADFGAARYAAFVLLKTGPPRFLDLGEAAPLDEQITAWRKLLAQQPPCFDADENLDQACFADKIAEVRQAARALDARLMEPVLGLTGTAEYLLLSPDGPLNLIPFAALVAEDGQYLVQRYTLNYLTSGRDLVRYQTALPGRSAPVAFGDPRFNLAATEDAGETRNGWPPPRLPATREEAEDFAEALPDAQIWLDAEATEERVKSVRGPRFFHVGTHGILEPLTPNPGQATRSAAREGAPLLPSNAWLRSYLMFSGVVQKQSGAGEDGYLTALEVSQLDLSGTRLAVLSACETGVGEVRQGEGVYGLRRALVLAGSEAQAVSLWQVGERSTRALMKEFYAGLDDTHGPAEALRQAQLKMLNAGGDAQLRAHPYYWAGFILSGKGQPLAD